MNEGLKETQKWAIDYKIVEPTCIDNVSGVIFAEDFIKTLSKYLIDHDPDIALEKMIWKYCGTASQNEKALLDTYVTVMLSNFSGIIGYTFTKLLNENDYKIPPHHNTQLSFSETINQIKIDKENA